jgi:hypothetical protein
MQELVNFFFKLSNQIKLYHWNTKSYARHVASGSLFDHITDKSDKFIEVYQGRYGKQDVSVTLEIGEISEETAVTFLKKAVKYLEDIVDNGLVKETDTDLLNIRDDIMGDINQTIYLFSFK